MSFTRVARQDEIKPGQCRTIRVGITRIAVWNVGGRFHAIEDACKHMKAPLSNGRIEGTTLVCGWHGWRYEITTGECHDKSWGCVKTFDIKLENGVVLVSEEARPMPDSKPDEDPDGDLEEFPTPAFRKK